MRADHRSPLVAIGVGLLLLTLLAAAFLFILPNRHRELPLPVLAEVPEFALTNQFDQRVTRKDLLGHIWIGDIIFTRCAGPCPKMTAQLRSVQQKIAPQDSIRFVSLTADPEFDQPGVLKKYAERFGIHQQTWNFLTGPKPELYRLATNGFKLALLDSNAPGQDQPSFFVHSTRLLLIDPAGKVRAYYDGVEPDAPKKILDAIRQLKEEGSR